MLFLERAFLFERALLVLARNCYMWWLLNVLKLFSEGISSLDAIDPAGRVPRSCYRGIVASLGLVGTR